MKYESKIRTISYENTSETMKGNGLMSNSDFDIREYMLTKGDERKYYFVLPHITASDIVNGVIENNSQIFKPNLSEAPIQKKKAQYFIDDYEKERLHRQAEISLKFDKDIYERVVGQYESPLILDLGSSDGTALLMRLKGSSCWHVVGIDHDEEMVKLANEAHSSDNAEYYVQDIEASDFVERTQQILSKMGREGFDIINVVLVLKHLKKPGRVLYKLRRLLNDNGTLIVRDYDDGLQYVFPDEKGHFARLFSIFKYDEYAGESYMGREAYHLLFEAGYSEISLERMGCPTIGYSVDEKEVEYESSFSYLKHDLELLVEKYPDNPTIKNDYEWYINSEEEIIEAFLRPGTVYVAGRMIYTAKK